MSLFPWLDKFNPTHAEVRAEIWRLGSRHHGEPLRGARDELAAKDVEPARAALLAACVRTLERR